MPEAAATQAPASEGCTDGVRDVWIGVDLGGTKMFAVAYDRNLVPLGQKRKTTKGHEGVEAGIERVFQLIRRALEEADVNEDRIAGIGFAAPGPLDLEDGIVLETPNLGWRNLPARELLEAEFNCPVVLLNDVDAGVYGEYLYGAAQGAERVFGLFPGTGIGGGGVINGEIVRGTRHSCFEVGHLQIDPSGPLCGCGSRGCLEVFASRLAISAQVAMAAYRGQAPWLMNEYGPNLSKIRSGAIRDAIANGDTVVEDIVRHAAERLGKAAAGLVNVLGPDVILLGGGLVEALPGLYADAVSRSVAADVMPPYRDTFRVAVVALGDYAAVKGAAAWARKCLQPANA